jgi:hypothetical protein
MKREVFNNSIGNPYSLDYPSITIEEENQIIAGLFEQLLLFDKITITTNRLNFALAFLINRLGINTVERLFDNGYINLMIWSPMLFSSNGSKQPDGTINESTIYGKPPLASGSLSNEDLDIEKNINHALVHFNFNRERKRIFTKQIAKHYREIPNSMDFSANSAKIVMDAYKSNNLCELGLPNEKEPEQLNVKQRQLLLSLGNKVLETAVLAKFNLKSISNYEHCSICKQNLNNIGKAYNISENTSRILNIEGLPNLKEFFTQEKIDFESVFRIRHLSNAKYFRKWINNVGENSNATEITKEYLNEIKGTNKFFASSEGKFLRNLGVFGITSVIGTLTAGSAGLVAGYGLGLLETYFLDNILLGKHPSMFIDDLRKEIQK